MSAIDENLAKILGVRPREMTAEGLLETLRRRLRFPPLFILLVVLPTALAAFYYLLIAAPIYVSEARFIVRTPSQPSPAAFGSLLQGVGIGIGQGETDAYAVHEYVMSRDAVADLERHNNLRAILARPKIDFLARVPGPFENRSFEDLYRAFSRFVTVGYDSTTGISTLRVEAFRADDAASLANALLDGGERVINRLNARALEDAVAEARKQVDESETRELEAEAEMTRFRNRERLIDPQRSSMAGLELVGKLEAQLTTLRADRQALAASAPQSPQLPVLDQQLLAFEHQLETERSKMAGENTSLAPKIGEYERLMIEREFAAKELLAASTAMDTARIEARRKRLYLERVIAPNTPDVPRMPRRWFSIALVLATSLLAYGTVVLIILGLREHSQS